MVFAYAQSKTARVNGNVIKESAVEIKTKLATDCESTSNRVAIRYVVTATGVDNCRTKTPKAMGSNPQSLPIPQATAMQTITRASDSQSAWLSKPGVNRAIATPRVISINGIDISPAK